jgi:hypothetical protein
VKTFRHETISRLPASRFPDPAQVYFCDSCGRDLTKNLYRDRAPVWQPLRPMWSVCQCGQKYLSGAAEWDDLSSWERKQRIRQLWIGLVLFALLVIPGALAYFALRYGGAALLAIVGIALIPSVLVAKPFGFVLLDLCEIITSIWRTRVIGRTAFSATIPRRRMKDFYPHKLRLTPIAAAIAMIIIATRWIPPHHAPASSMGAMSSPPRANAGRQESLSLPAKLPRPPVAKVAVPGAPSPAFRRVQVGPNEVDYIAEDVTIRHFLPTVKQPRIQPAYKEVHIGPDVTIRYFASKPADATQTRLVSLDRSLPLSK